MTLSKTKLLKKIRMAKTLLSNNIQNANDGFYVPKYHDGILKEKYTWENSCKKKTCNGQLVDNGKECFSLWKKDGSGEQKKATPMTSQHCDTCFLDQPTRSEYAITKSINKKIMIDNSIGESSIADDMKFIYFLLEKLDKIEIGSLTKFNAEKTDILEKEIVSFWNRIKSQNGTIYKVFDNNKILNFDEIEKQITISKMRNTELSVLLREILTYDNLEILASELEFLEIIVRQNNFCTTKFKLVKVYAEPKKLSKINSKKLDDSMRSDMLVDFVFQSKSELLSQIRYDDNFKRIATKEILKERIRKTTSDLERTVAERQIERMEIEECL